MRVCLFLLVCGCSTEPDTALSGPPVSTALPSAAPTGGATPMPEVTATSQPSAAAPTVPPEEATPYWPEGKRAAVTLTYDDGLDGQLKYAIPSLDARGLKATFFLSSFQGVPHGWALPDPSTPLTSRHDAWASVSAAGHELAGHTVFHPCDSNNTGYKPQDYDLERMALELDESLVRLARLDASSSRSFAYPCDTYENGLEDGVSFEPLVQARFAAARVGTLGTADPMTVDLHQIPQHSVEVASAATLIEAAAQALLDGHWIVFSFHGIGPQEDCDISSFDLETCALNYLTTSALAHDELLDYLATDTEFWVAPLNAVAAHVSSKR